MCVKLNIFVQLFFLANAFNFEFVNFDEALDFWKQIIEAKPHMLSQLQGLLNESKQLSKKSLIVKIGLWTKQDNELQVF